MITLMYTSDFVALVINKFSTIFLLRTFFFWKLRTTLGLFGRLICGSAAARQQLQKIKKIVCVGLLLQVAARQTTARQPNGGSY